MARLHFAPVASVALFTGLASAVLSGTIAPSLAHAAAPGCTQLLESRSLADGPRLHSHSMILDPLRDRLLVYGGSASSVTESWVLLDGLWEFPLATSGPWRPITTENGIGPRIWHSAIYDPVRDRMIVHGGLFGTNQFAGGTWALELGRPVPRWTLLDVIPVTGPLPRMGQGAIYDPVGDRMIIHGGLSGQTYAQSTVVGDVWALGLSGTPAWERLRITIPGSRRWKHAMAYDAARGDFVVYGGHVSATGFGWNNGNDAQAYDVAGGTWRGLAVGAPALPLNAYPAAAIDPAGDRLLLYGITEDVFAGPTRELPLATADVWRVMPRHSCSTGHSARYDGATAFDPGRGRMYFHGGVNQVARGELVALDLEADAIRLDLEPGDPHNTINPRSGRNFEIVFFGSATLDARDIDARALSFAGARVDTIPVGQLSVRYLDHDGDGFEDLAADFRPDRLTLRRGEHIVDVEGCTRLGNSPFRFCGSERVRIVGPNGIGNGDPSEIEPSGPAADSDEERAEPFVRVASGNPGPGPVRIAYRLPGGTAGRLEVFDVTGRRRASLSLAGSGQEATLALTGAAAWPRGIYELRLGTADGIAIGRRARLVLTR